MRLVLLSLTLVLGGCSEDEPEDPYAIYACKPQVTSGLGDGYHLPGTDCQSACHDHGFTISGTIFTDATGTTPYPGATVTIRDKNLKMFSAVTETNGNFWTMETFDYPFRAWVTSCPDTAIMSDTVDKNTGLGTSCNQGVCHNNAAGQGVITLPR